MKSGEDHLFFLTAFGSFQLAAAPRIPWQQLRRTLSRAVIFFLVILVIAGVAGGPLSAQSSSDATETLGGIVIDSVTHQPVARALVYSSDNRFAMLTNSEGRFEFTVPKPADDSGSGSARTSRPESSGRPYSLQARKPGFLTDSGHNLPNGTSQEMTIALVPEALIIGTVKLPTSEAPDAISVQIFRRQVQEGRAHWVPAGGAQSKSDGQFRFAGLGAGTYKLLTNELLDRDPATTDPLNIDGFNNGPLKNDPRGQLFGYPPVYYQNASDFASASTIQLPAGQTQIVDLSLVKQPYFRVKLPVNDATGGDAQGINISVYAHGGKGPGFSLGYSSVDHAVEGMLPNGTYTIEATSFGPTPSTGLQTINIKGASIGGPGLTLVGNAAIPVVVKEEFTGDDHSGSMTWNINGRNVPIKGPRRYLNVTLEPADDFVIGRGVSLREPTSADGALFIEGAPAGRYWVQVQSSRGYPASIRSGNLDLQHQPLVVGVGGAASPIEITMRDDTAEISGTVAGVTPPASGTVPSSNSPGAMTFFSNYSGSFGGQGPAGAHLYCIPLADSGGQFQQGFVNPADGSFDLQGVAPGAYRLIAFDQAQRDLEYRNPEAMEAYDAKGPVVRVSAGQTEHVQLQVISGDGTAISSGEASNEE